MSSVASSIPVTAMLLVSAVTIGAPVDAADREADQEGREPNQAREVTYKDAHDLLTAFLKVSPRAVEQSGDTGYNGFYFFMLTWEALAARTASVLVTFIIIP